MGFLNIFKQSKENEWDQLNTDIENRLTARLKKLEEQEASKWGDVQENINERLKIANSLKLGERLVKIHSEINRYPELIINGGGNEVLPIVQSPIRKNRGEEEVMEFKIGGISYAIGRKQRAFSLPDGSPANHADFQFYAPLEHSVLMVIASLEGDINNLEWRPFQIESFIPGDWIKDFLRLNEEVAVGDEILSHEVFKEFESVDEAKNKFGL